MIVSVVTGRCLIRFNGIFLAFGALFCFNLGLLKDFVEGIPWPSDLINLRGGVTEANGRVVTDLIWT